MHTALRLIGFSILLFFISFLLTIWSAIDSLQKGSGWLAVYQFSGAVGFLGASIMGYIAHCFGTDIKELNEFYKKKI